MAVAQKLKEAEVTEQNSLLLTRNLLRIAIFNITYIRGLFPEKYFNDKSVPALEMKIKKLMPVDPESRRLIDWMEKGVYDALQKKYLKTLLFCVCESIEGSMIEEYAFSFSYSSSDSQEVSMNVNRTGNKKQGGTFKCDSVTEITPNQMKSSACKMVRTLVQLMRTLDKMPEERTILMKLLYYDDVTPVDYEPPFFRSCTEEEAHNAWMKNPLKMDVGNVNSKHFVLTLKVKSVLDPCEDENDDIQDNVSLGADSGHRDEFSESDSEVYQSEEDQYMIAPADKQRGNEDTPMVDDDDTQDPAEDEQQLSRIKDWISSWHLDTVELTDILSNFPDISVVLIEEIMENLVKEDFLSKFGRDSYTIKKRKESDYDFSAVKERDCQVGDFADKASPRSDEDYMYMKALYHALPMSYVTVSKLQTKFEGQVKQGTVRKLIEKMSREGYIEAKGNRGLGKRVIHSNLTEQKLNEIKKALDYDTMEVDVDNLEKGDKEIQTMGNRPRDTSTCGGVHSIGSELTRTKGRSDMHENGSIRSEQTSSMRREQVNILTSPTSKEEPLTSRESFAAGKENNSRLNGNTNHCDEVDVICSRGSQEKRSRKASTVKEPILQNMKRQKAVA